MPAASSRAAAVASRQAGFTYLGLMFLVAILALATAATLTLGSIAQRREAEQRLLEVGDAYRRAISSYLNSSPAGDRRYPTSLADLLRDPRYPGVRRHLRQLYPDPVTGKNQWGLVPAPGGGIMGVHSLSDARPIRIAGFDFVDRSFEDRDHYSEWLFVVRPGAAVAGPKVGQPANALTAPALPSLLPSPDLSPQAAVPGAGQSPTPANSPLFPQR